MILLIIIDSIIDKIKKDQRKNYSNTNGLIYTIPSGTNLSGTEVPKKEQFIKQQFREMREYFGDKF